MAPTSDTAQVNKPHRGTNLFTLRSKCSTIIYILEHKTGGKVKKQKRLDLEKNAPQKGNNLKGNTFHSAIKAGRSIRRLVYLSNRFKIHYFIKYTNNFSAADLSEKKKHVLVVDRSPVLPPPIIVAIVGPSKVSLHSLLHLNTLKHFKNNHEQYTL